MTVARAALFVALGVAGAVFTVAFARGLLRARREGERVLPKPWELAVGGFTNFFDTLGIGSFAPTTTLYRARREKTVDDRLLPGTLNVGHTIPTFVEAYIFIDKIAVEPTTLVLMIAAATLGALVGAPYVARLSRPRVQIGMGCALLLVSMFVVWRQLGIPQDGLKNGLGGGALALAVATNFALGALMTIGVGLYAPCLVVISLLGMSPKAGFPIMMGSCAFLQAFGSIPFIRSKSFAPAASLGLTLGGVPFVLLAAFIVKELPLYWAKWLVAAVIVYTALALLRAGLRRAPTTGSAVAPSA